MNDLTQFTIVTLFAAVALAALLRPYVRPAGRKGASTGDAGCPGCGTCDDAPAPSARR